MGFLGVQHVIALVLQRMGCITGADSRLREPVDESRVVVGFDFAACDH